MDKESRSLRLAGRKERLMTLLKADLPVITRFRRTISLNRKEIAARRGVAKAFILLISVFEWKKLTPARRDTGHSLFRS